MSQKTSPDNIQRAYRSKLHQAKADGDDDLVFIIEQAHSSIMMRELSNRMQVDHYLLQLDLDWGVYRAKLARTLLMQIKQCICHGDRESQWLIGSS